MIVELCVVGILITILVVYGVYLYRVLKYGLSITDKKLWIGDGGSARSLERSDVTGDAFDGKMCRLEAVGSAIKDQYGGTVKEDREIPCGTCSNFSYKVGGLCMPYTAKFEYTNFGDEMNFMGYCDVSDEYSEPRECGFRTPLQT